MHRGANGKRSAPKRRTLQQRCSHSGFRFQRTCSDTRAAARNRLKSPNSHLSHALAPRWAQLELFCLMETRFLRNAITLGLLSAIGPFAIDMYLPALPEIGRGLQANTGAVQMSLT